MSKRRQQIEATDRSMDPVRASRGLVFFFPKRTPPVSVRAASREEAERLLEASNP